MKLIGNYRINKLSRTVLIAVFLVAGINHFVMPEVYLLLIPPYIPFPEFVNLLSGVFEILGALGLIFTVTRKWAAYGLILLLLAFIPAHIYIFEIGPKVNEWIYIPHWLAWLRLLVVHPLLILWIWTNRK